ncbi:MAG: class I SAM-dependent methyltransferase [Halothece sp. Uz-M2-17]|nr:class I SAM-dependent methyltransferase [Halothece sp. Uz-M2-17]
MSRKKDQNFTTCNVCEQPQTFEVAKEVKVIPSNMSQFKHQQFTVWRCNNCHTLHSKEAVDLDLYYENYFKKINLNYFTSCAYWQQIQLLKKYGLKQSHNILDFGCNQGSFLKVLKQLGYRQAKGYDPYVSEFADSTILNDRYDVITSYDVIEHVEKPRLFFQQMVRCLEIGGLLLIGTPNATQVDFSDIYCPELHQPYHRHILSQKALINLGLSSGLEVVKVIHRWCYDTLLPGVNTRFILSYVKRLGNMIDCLEDPPHIGMVLTSPLLLFYFFWGYFFPTPGNVIILFRRCR